MKRFVASEMWDKSWFRKLTPKHKTLWLYLFTKCDCAGVWEPDFEMASFAIGDTITVEDMSAYGDRVERLACGKWWLNTFVSFQYGDSLNDKSSVHRGVMKLMHKHGIRVA
jgi:hypothetical protein